MKNGMKFPPPNRASQRGISMVELSVVLVVVALISAAVFFGLQANARRIEVQDNTSQITEIAAELKKNFGRNNQYGVLTTALAVQSRAIPEQLRVTATTAQNSYGGLVTTVVSPAATCTLAGACADLLWPSVPQNQCMDLVIGTSNVARVVDVGGTAVKVLDGQLNMATLATQCEAAASTAITYSVGR